MKISTLQTGFFKLDGGAMFGIIPKRLWQKLNPPDENNLCTWAMRCLLVQHEGRNILIDTGMGTKKGDKFLDFFEPHGEDSLIGSLQKHGLQPEDISDVFLTHLHFDHAGGAVKWNEDGQPVPAFPNAVYWTNRLHYEWACHPNDREKASFIHDNFLPLEAADQLRFIPVKDHDIEWFPGFRIRFVYGHTEAMMLPIIETAEATWMYCADLIPSAGHIGLPYIMSYDVRPLATLLEKEKLLAEAADRGYRLIFEHDPRTAACTLVRNEHGRIHAGENISI
ncbi:MAG TPA: MBL fold metallo-hydrolase [Saprospiraceae bacterium]|nr:MBL fold metallo-hydrolase [Saprospiraceae bacterium]